MSRRSAFPTPFLARSLRGAIFFAATGAAALIAVPARASANEPAVDPYAVLEKLGHRDRIPRLLTTEDAGMSALRPEALQPVLGDFDGDGTRDMAIAGVYNLPADGRPYFLLVAGNIDRAPRLLLAEDGATPFFLHPPGTTGNGDPGDQAFSLTTCINCAKGEDFRWNARGGKFRRTAWRADRMVTTTAIGPKPAPAAPNVPDETADKALRIAGRLKDVREFVGELEAGGGKLGTRVEPVSGSKKRVRVLIFEKKPGEEKLYDAIEIDLAAERVVGRKRG